MPSALPSRAQSLPVGLRLGPRSSASPRGPRAGLKAMSCPDPRCPQIKAPTAAFPVSPSPLVLYLPFNATQGGFFFFSLYLNTRNH